MTVRDRFTAWRKSSYSGASSDCVEVAVTAPAVGVRCGIDKDHRLGRLPRSERAPRCSPLSRTPGGFTGSEPCRPVPSLSVGAQL